MAAITCEFTWLTYLLQALQVTVPSPAKLYCDNQTTQHIAAYPVFHERTKHIEMDCHMIREKIQSCQITTAFTPSYTQLVDIFTKPLGKAPFHSHLRKFVILNIYART